MKHRRQTPDIIADLMGEKISNKTIEPESNTAVAQADNNPIKSASNKTSEPASLAKIKPAHGKDLKQVGNKAIKPDNNKTSKQVRNIVLHNLIKEKATFNLSKQLLEALDDAWILLRRAKKKDQRITKTLLVEVALQLALDDLQKKGEKSDLYRCLEIE